MKSATSAPEAAPSSAPRGSFTTVSGRPIARVYTPADISSLDYERDLGDPGAFPYTRGIHRGGYGDKLWTMRQFAGFGTPEETNARYKQLLAAGGTGLITRARAVAETCQPTKTSRPVSIHTAQVRWRETPAATTATAYKAMAIGRAKSVIRNQ